MLQINSGGKSVNDFENYGGLNLDPPAKFGAFLYAF
jgi:hypothetical protein